MMFRLQAGGPALLAEHGILRAGEAAAVLDGDALIAAARQHADALLAKAQARALDIEQAAADAAAQRRADAEAEAQALRLQAEHDAQAAREQAHAEATREAVELWHAQHAELAAAKAALADGSERELAEVVMQAVRRIVEAQPREALYARALQAVEDLLRQAGSATLRVAEADAEAAAAAVAAWPEAAARGWRVTVQADPALAAGSAVFASDIGMLDASLDHQLAALRQALDRAVAQAAAGDAASSGPAEGHDHDA